MTPRTARGVTLLELLVALAIFAIIGVAAYSALFSVLDARETTKRESARLAAVQYAVGRLGDDLRQAVARPVQTAQPEDGAALAAPGTGAYLFALTRGGWPNPARVARSTLVRVSWSLDGKRLLRSWHARPDALASVEPVRRIMLEDVDDVQLRFLDKDGHWNQRWPPLNASPGTSATRLPRAVEVTLKLSDWGEIRRLFALPVGAPAAKSATATTQGVQP